MPELSEIQDEEEYDKKNSNVNIEEEMKDDNLLKMINDMGVKK